MICCTLAALLLGAPALLLARAFPSVFGVGAQPLAWRLHPDGRRPQRPRAFSIMARIRSFGFAFDGLGFLVRNEHNAWLHAFASMAATGAGLMLGITLDDWRWIAAAITMVWAAEAFNTAIEAVCNLVSPGRNEHVRNAKDVAAGAVLVVAIGAAVIGILTFLPYLARHAHH